MHYHRFSYLVGALLLVPNASSTSYAATIVYAQTVKGLIYKSTDSAKTWQALATPTLPNTAGLGSGLFVDPQNTNNLYAMYVTPGLKGRSSSENGINRSTDGGQSWTGTVLESPVA